MAEGEKRRLKNMSLERRRDNQQWMLDWMVKTTGRDRGFFYDVRTLPPSVKSYAMIPREMEKLARHKETMARAAEENGHYTTARELYQKAVVDYHWAQHALPHDDDSEKIYLCDKLNQCFDRVIKYSPTPTERVEIPWEGKSLPAIFYGAPQQREPGPTIFFCNGMDVVKELFPDPLSNPFVARGMNVLVVDGPGQGASNLRKIRVTPDSWQRSAKVVLDYLVSRPEVNPEKVGAVGFSMGSYWQMSFAARDRRVKAVATGAACYGAKRGIFEMDSPHFKKIFMYMAGIHDEDTFDEMVDRMALTDEEVASITAACLMVVGEYDSMTPLEEAVHIFDGLRGPKEFWLMENDSHTPFLYPHLGGYPAFGAMADWLLDVLEGRKPADLNRKVVLHPDRGRGVYGADAPGFFLPERLRVE
ncbi:MAG: alpha/beta hydrolase family protein [Chloroflexota bacterium]